MGIKLFDRSGRYPRLTAAGIALLFDARGIVVNVDFMKARARGMAFNLEPELSVVVDVHYPHVGMQGEGIKVNEIVPPAVQMDLMRGQANEVSNLPLPAIADKIMEL